MKKQSRPASLDGMVPPRRSLTDRRAFLGNNPRSTSSHAAGTKQELNRPRRGFNTAELDAGLNAIPESKETIKSRFKRKKHLPRRPAIIAGLAVFLLVGFFIVQGIIALQRITERNLSGGALALQDDIDPSQLKKEGDGRVNILVIGIGDTNHPGADLADTIMVVSIDPRNNEVAMLSVPRDLYLRVPNYWSMRINAVHAVGESNKIQKEKGGGPALLAESVEQILGVDMHYFVRVDFSGFIKAVDTVGGVTINNEKSIFDPFIEDSYGSGRSGFSLRAGEHHLDGRRALQYGRSRKTSSDFARADRQQQVLVALKQKILSLNTLTNPVRISGLISSAGNHVRTDLRIPDEVMKLVEIGRRIEEDKISNFVLSNAPDNFLASRNIGGAAVMVPRAGMDNFEDIKRFVRSEFMVDGFIKQENAQITILNGTNRAGLAARAGEYLKDYGYRVFEVGDAPTKDVSTTTIYDQTGGTKPFTLRYLELRLGTKPLQQSPPGILKSSDIVIILGDNFRLP